MSARLPRTKTQRWLKSENACFQGRHRVGALTLGEYWRVCTNASDMRWLLRRLEHGPLSNYYTESCKSIRAIAEFAGTTMPIGLV